MRRLDWAAVGFGVCMVSSSILLCVGCHASSVTPPNPTISSARSLTERVRHEGIPRTYHIYLPEEFKQQKSLPLVLALHGGGGTGRQFDQALSQGQLKTIANQRGVILVFPDGMNRQWSDGRTQHLKRNKSYDDVGFISKVIDRMIDDYGVDSQRVYVTGISNGGFMSVRLALDLSDKIAAIAPVTAQLPLALQDKTPKQPISVMIVNGTEDPIVPYQGGHVRLFRFGRSRGEILSTADTIEHFRLQNNCQATPKKISLPDKNPNDSTRVEMEQYTGCADQTEVTLVKVIGGGHTWPGGAQYLKPKLIGRVSKDINAGAMIIDFFLKHSR
ncbi:PHB depolymerase family esterase [Acaryochloris marina]|uniref:extracellular catalytic domain type 1 short-chain-length polyhydroxyalkanoate depolymerase n=1 Tax=Acaryochloris marina TaxID=155978 RepID=UPI001BB03E98|nr:PHB depolymerase family esterase [Acaryochloris marina]QUY43520.1 prolyl oligopeptidase family serine peptidase [Acaryochloris marina S15]